MSVNLFRLQLQGLKLLLGTLKTRYVIVMMVILPVRGER